MSFGARSPRGRDAGEVLEPGDRQVLAVVAIRVAEEPAGHPLEAGSVPPATRSSCVHTFAFVASKSGASSV